MPVLGARGEDEPRAKDRAQGKGPNMNATEYISRRLQPETDWYDQKAMLEKRWYLGLTIGGFGASASVPASIAAGSPDWLPAVLGSLVAIFTGVLSLRKSQENWLNYRK